LAFSLDGARVAIGHDDGTINLWPHRDSSVEQLAKLIYDEVIELSFHPDGKLLLATGRERMYLWNAHTRQLINQHSTGSAIGAPLHAAFSPDGRMLAWFSYSGTGVVLMDARARHRFGPPLFSDDRAPWSLAFSPDGKTIAVAYQEGTILFWDLDPESWIQRARNIANRDLTAEERDQYLGSPSTLPA
jgi:WD40 repeat protein